jgi:hypothetical protein
MRPECRVAELGSLGHLAPFTMKSLGMVFGCLLLGAVACCVSVLVLVTPEHRGGGSWDMSPLAGILLGAPTWLVSFPVIYSFSRAKAKDRSSCFAIATVGAFILTIAIPFLIIRSQR